MAFGDFRDVPIVVYEDDTRLMNRVIGRIEAEVGCSLNAAVRTKSLLAAMELVGTAPMSSSRPRRS